MNDFNRETTTSISFPQAIATTQSLMKQIEAGELDEEEIETKIASLVNSKQGARGFFVAYLTGDLPLADNPSVGVINALKSAPHLVGELLVKNVAMSTAMAVTHRRNNDTENTQESEKVARRSINLIKQLNLDVITKELIKLQTSLTTGEGSYQEFLDKWGYDAEQKEMIGFAIERLSNEQVRNK
ncbi:MAG: hypothetical protein QNJ41_17580 [Xenococcaceae cyanobacterium MO_188.B32]|nr:hypothetical protein [Xenococcaceae cyanobacterium MO_188.B32]